ncbi:TetR/AcrR family transcriptional regulator [Saccharopolyspora sp. 5N708]|uniref:TetR/AcrR family transcriptional regulator n=1 Tax=Saccharopolyspora sp. 5N708 TaxID=3457424 RepID=UPI003FD2EA2A
MTATAKLIRERGSTGTSVQELMSSVGLTHGGFYKHFKSKDELLGLAVTAAFGELASQLTQISEDFPDRAQAWRELLGGYLSTEHRDDSGAGCASTALACDAARAPAGSPLRTSYLTGVGHAIALIAEFQEAPGQTEDDAHRRAIVGFATMVGALTLARATGRTPLSDTILQVVHDALEGDQPTELPDTT